MNDTSTPTEKPAATFRAWEAVVIFRECGVVTERRVYAVTLARTADGFAATVNGQPCPHGEAARLLNMADRVTVTAETLEAPTPPTIGKARASKLHRLMARAGVPTGEHYGFAGAALDRPVYSLAALTEEDARAVWRFLAFTHPSIQAAA